MSQYRIIQTGEGFKIQEKFLWFFWLDCVEPTFQTSCDGHVSDGESFYYIYDSYNEAISAIERLKHLYYEYKGHTIQYGYLYFNEIYFVDLSSKYKNYKGDKAYKIYGKTLEEVKMYIDKDIEKKEKEKNKNKIINIYYV